MAHISFQSFLKGVQGKFGRVVVRKIRGRYFLSNTPDPQPKRKPTAG